MLEVKREEVVGNQYCTLSVAIWQQASVSFLPCGALVSFRKEDIENIHS